MKLKVILLITALLVISALGYAFLKFRQQGEKEERSEKPTKAQSKEERPTSREAVVSLDEKTQNLIGLETTVLASAKLPPEIKCYGRVLDSSSLVGLLSSVASARAALEASGKEYERVKGLFDQGENASARALEAADATMKRDRISLQTAEAQLVSAWGKSVADQPDLPGLVESLTALRLVLARLDLPAGDPTSVAPVSGRLILPGTGESVNGRFLGPATTTDPQVQGQGYLFVVTNTSSRLSPGLALTAFLEVPGAPLQGVIVPEAGVVRAAERAWVYLQTSPTNFTRRDINLDHPVAEGWFVTKGVAPNDRIVTTGAQALLSEERKTEIKVGD